MAAPGAMPLPAEAALFEVNLWVIYTDQSSANFCFIMW
jgi:hypothetical protein